MDLEAAVSQSHPALVRNGAAAFEVETANGEVGLTVVQEVGRDGEGDGLVVGPVGARRIRRESQARSEAEAPRYDTSQFPRGGTAESDPLQA